MTDTEQQQLLLIEQYVKEMFGNDAGGHDYYHILRVKNMAMRIAEGESACIFTTAVAALLHEYDDAKLMHITGGPGAARRLMQQVQVNDEVQQHVFSIISKVSFRGAQVHTAPESLEGRCVQDADRLDAIGAIGIARTFAFGGAAGRLMHQPGSKPASYNTPADYHKARNTAINHFYEKLLLLKDRMNTNEARRIAEARHAYMMGFLDEFFAEWDTLR